MDVDRYGRIGEMPDDAAIWLNRSPVL